MQSTSGHPCRCSIGDDRYFSQGRCQACEGRGIRNPSREKTIDRNIGARQPSWQEYLAFDGAHCKNIYRGLDDNWNCPGCGRTKYQILRWTMLFPNSPTARRPGWAGGYHRHHDHSMDRYLFIGKPAGLSPRFESTIICEQCNSADATAKRKLNLPPDFSFAPLEIRQFVTGYAHGKHLLDYARAQSIYAALIAKP